MESHEIAMGSNLLIHLGTHLGHPSTQFMMLIIRLFIRCVEFIGDVKY